MKKKIVFFILNIAFISQIYSQSIEEMDSAHLVIPPLAEVLDAASLQSAVLKLKALDVQVIEEELKMVKKKWLNSIYLEGTMRYGYSDQFIIRGLDTLQANSLAKSQQFRYSVGFGLKLPLSAIANRRNEIKIKQINYEQVAYELEDLEERLRQRIIDEYFKLKFLETSMNTFSSIYQTLDMGYLKAEKDLLAGKMTLPEYALLVSTLGKARDDFFKAKNNFHAQYYKLQELTGMNFK